MVEEEFDRRYPRRGGGGREAMSKEQLAAKIERELEEETAAAAAKAAEEALRRRTPKRKEKEKKKGKKAKGRTVSAGRVRARGGEGRLGGPLGASLVVWTSRIALARARATVSHLRTSTSTRTDASHFPLAPRRSCAPMPRPVVRSTPPARRCGERLRQPFVFSPRLLQQPPERLALLRLGRQLRRLARLGHGRRFTIPDHAFPRREVRRAKRVERVVRHAVRGPQRASALGRGSRVLRDPSDARG